MVSLYIHIPFCRKKCHYCSFSSYADRSLLFQPYLTALKRELALVAEKGPDRRQLQSLFIGGGTPSVFPCDFLTELVGYCQVLFPPVSDVEITVEANPGTVDEPYLLGLLSAGVNRLSLGVQTFNDYELKQLGRIHDSNVADLAVEAAKNAGFLNINLDLMYGLPGQTAESWRASLMRGIALGPQHLSIYQLSIEEGTPFYHDFARKRFVLPDEDAILLMDETSARLCREEDLQQYEIANFAIPGFECLHNLNYWRNGNYLACGASAVSYIEGVRERRISDPMEYIRRIRNGVSVVIESECLSHEASFRESVILGLRMTRGVSQQQLFDRYHIDIKEYYNDILEKYSNLRLIEFTDSHLRLTAKGRAIANWIMADLV
jgi:oxygen-independent coproporphyrinogen III oxidase